VEAASATFRVCGTRSFVALDAAGVKNRKQARSRYGAKLQK
jgi:ribosomal protein S12